MVKWDDRKKNDFFRAKREKRSVAVSSVDTGKERSITLFERIASVASAPLGILLTVISSAIGAGVATFFSVNYLEAFKAEEKLRSFAVSQIYQPMREQSTDCQSKQLDLVAHTATISGIFNTLHKGVEEYVGNSKGSTFAMVGAQIAQPLIKQLGESQKMIGTRTKELAVCTKVIEHLGHELATVLGLNSEYQKIVAAQRQRKAEIAQPSENTDFIMMLLKNPGQLGALTRAFEDASDGDAARMTSALTKIQAGLTKSTASEEQEYKYQLDVSEAMSLNENERTELFLRNLRMRFERTPKFQLEEALREIF